MKNLILELIIAILVFLLFKVMIVLLSKIVNKVFKVDELNRKKFDFGISLALQLIFIAGWIASVGSTINKFGLTDLECYISLCLIGCFSVIWCYFSWDAEHIWVRPCKASTEEKRKKKIFIYFLILVFVLWQGYYQTVHAVNDSVEVDKLFSLTNYSIIVGTIAFDRLMNQIVKAEE